MPIKTILLHMADDERHFARLRVAVDLAERFKAHVDALFVATPVAMPAEMTGRGASMAYIANATTAAHQRAAEIEREVHTRCANLSHDFTTVEGDHAEILAERSILADIAVITQAHPAHLEDRIPLQVPDQLPLAGPCPALVVPWEDRIGRPLGRTIMVAWDRSKEAGRALRDARPFLTTAERVLVVTANPSSDNDEANQPSVIDYLKRHGVAAERRIVTDRSTDAGQVLLTLAKQEACDLLVMGAYGHSRWRELVLGGVTRTILGHMHLPVLMSH